MPQATPDLDLPHYPPHKRLTGAEAAHFAEKVVAAYTRKPHGASIRAICAASGRSYGSIHRILQNAPGVTLRARGGPLRTTNRLEGVKA